MGSKGYVAIGHGMQPNGVYDPGAVVPGSGKQEHEFAKWVVNSMIAILDSDSRLETYFEKDGGAGHDPDYRGSAAAVNKMGAQWAIEIHFDYHLAPTGGFGLFVSTAGLNWANRIRYEYQWRGLPVRDNARRPNLYFLTHTKCPALIWECDRVSDTIDPGLCVRYGEAIAMGTIRWLEGSGMIPAASGGVPIAPIPQPPAPAPSQPTEPVDSGTRPDSRPARAFPGHLLAQGSHDSASVRAVQQRLHDLGYGITVDGGFGPQTKGIVIDFQRDQGLPQDGIVGPQTWSKMFR